MLPADPIESSEPVEPIDPIEPDEAIEPIDANEHSESIENVEPTESIDQRLIGASRAERCGESGECIAHGDDRRTLCAGDARPAAKQHTVRNLNKAITPFIEWHACCQCWSNTHGRCSPPWPITRDAVGLR